MKANVKKQMQRNRDTQAFTVLFLYVLWRVSELFNFGTKRLQRLYDAVMLEMYKDQDDATKGFYYQDFAERNGLTAEAFAERQQEALQKFEQEHAEQKERDRQASLAWEKEQKAKFGEHALDPFFAGSNQSKVHKTIQAYERSGENGNHK
jgi:hypothetical protein